MDKNEKPTATVSSLVTVGKTKEQVSEPKGAASTAQTEHMDKRPYRPSYVRMMHNFHLVWLDESIDEMKSNDCSDAIAKFRQVVDTVNTFVNVDECIDFITDINGDNVFMISADTLSHTTTTVLQDAPQVRAIYIFCENKTRHEQWATQWSKVKGVFTDILPICQALKQAAQDYNQNSVSMSFVKPSISGATNNLDQLDQSFMYTQILKEILLTIDFEQKHFMEFITYYREQSVGNIVELENVNKLEKEYRLHQPIWWYTYQSFLYSTLNRALRTMEVDLIIKMGFFIRNLHEHVTELHSEQDAGQQHSTSFTLYRGQGLSKTHFDQLVKTKGGLMSFNTFLSTSLDRAVSLAFAESNQSDPDLIGVLFEITINPSISSTPFANIRDVSYFQGEEETLFSMHSIFRVGQVEQMDNNPRLWQVDLTLTSDNDPQLRTLTECIRNETFPQQKGWYRLGSLLLKLGQFDKAQQVCEVLLDQSTDARKKGNIYGQLAYIKDHQGKYIEALSYYEKALQIYQKTLPENHLDLASSYNNIGLVYDKMGEYSKALFYYEKNLGIRQTTLPVNHPSLATSYNNIGSVYDRMGEYSKTLSYYEESLKILQKTLPANHPDLATSYNNLGSVYDKIGKCSKALPYYEKALEIFQKTLPTNHPLFAISYNNIGLMYDNMGEYLKALSSHEKALEIRQKTLPANHPYLATAYNNIGLMYDKMGAYPKALFSHENALKIRQKTLPENHPDLATSYNNIGWVYDKMGEYSKALLSHEKALEIRQKTLPANHPHFAAFLNNIGGVYLNLGEYSKSVSYCERVLQMLEHSLPADHPNLQVFKTNLEYVKTKL